MKHDASLQLSSDQAVTDTDAYTEASLDFGDVTPKRDPFAGEPMALVFIVGTAAAGSTDTTDIMAVQSAASNLGSHTVLAQRRIANANLTVGSVHVITLPPGVQNLRYFGGRTELGASDTITWKGIWLMPLKDVQQYDRYYDSGFTVD